MGGASSVAVGVVSPIGSAPVVVGEASVLVGVVSSACCSWGVVCWVVGVVSSCCSLVRGVV